MKTFSMWRVIAMALVLSGVALYGPDAAKADEIDELIKRITTQSRTRGEAAAKMLVAAKSLDAQASRVRLWTAASELGMTGSSSYPTVLEALDNLEKAAPEKTGVWRDKRLAVYREMYYRGARADRAANGQAYANALEARAGEIETAGDRAAAVKLYRQAYGIARSLYLSNSAALLDKAKALEARVLVDNRIKGLKGIIERSPSSVSAREQLVVAYVVDLDAPEEAAKYLADGMNAALRKNVALAAVDASAMEDEDFVTLGRWYATLSKRATAGNAKANMLNRARDNFKMYLEVHTDKDVKRFEISNALKAVEARLSALAGSGAVTTPKVTPRTGPFRAKWVDMLALTNPERHGGLGQWVRQGRTIAFEYAKHTTGVFPLTAAGSYDFRVTFTVVRGHVLALAAPMGKGKGLILVGTRRGRLIVLERAGPNDSNPTKNELPEGSKWFANGVRNTFDLSVRIKDDEVHVVAALNGKKVMDWTGRHAPLNVAPFWSMPPVQTFGLGTHGGTVICHSMKIRMLDPADANVEWVSKDATFKSSSVARGSVSRSGFLNGRGRLVNGMGICTDREQQPHIVITLKRTYDIKQILLVNRRGTTKYPLDGLTVWTSTDGKTWARAWKLSGKPERMWFLDFGSAIQARYVKIGLDGSGLSSLQLADVRVYGTSGATR